jgi:hypothetical protein
MRNANFGAEGGRFSAKKRFFHAADEHLSVNVRFGAFCGLKSHIVPCPRSARLGHWPDYSITSSARASSLSGIWRPSAFAVLRLMTRWNLVACWTGRSAGFSPLRIRPQ